MRKNYYFIFLLLFLMISCQKEEIKTQQSLFIDYQTNLVSFDVAKDIASSFVAKEFVPLGTRGDNLFISNSFEINSSEGSPLLQVFNYEGGGFVIVSRDNRLEPILAYSDQNHFERLPFGYPDGLEIWLDNLRREKTYYDENLIEQSKSIKMLWERYSNAFETKSLTPEDGIDPECDTIVGPLVTDTWNQYSPYNENLNYEWHTVIHASTDTLYTDSAYLLPVVGGLPLSIARIMHFWSFPSSYPWSSMSNTSADSYNKSLLTTVHNSAKSYASSHGYSFNYLSYILDNTGYSDLSTNVSISFPIDTYLKSSLGFTSATTINYSLSDRYIIRREIFDNSRPVILTGKYSNNS